MENVVIVYVGCKDQVQSYFQATVDDIKRQFAGSLFRTVFIEDRGRAHTEVHVLPKQS